MVRVWLRLVGVVTALALPCLGLPCSPPSSLASFHRCSCCPSDAPCGCCAGPVSPGDHEHSTLPSASAAPDKTLPTPIDMGPSSTAASGDREEDDQTLLPPAAVPLFLTQHAFRC
jgi:hypothetical protein